MPDTNPNPFQLVRNFDETENEFTARLKATLFWQSWLEKARLERLLPTR
jgi:hypothetical protein